MRRRLVRLLRRPVRKMYGFWRHNICWRFCRAMRLRDPLGVGVITALVVVAEISAIVLVGGQNEVAVVLVAVTMVTILAGLWLVVRAAFRREKQGELFGMDPLDAPPPWNDSLTGWDVGVFRRTIRNNAALSAALLPLIAQFGTKKRPE